MSDDSLKPSEGNDAGWKAKYRPIVSQITSLRMLPCVASSCWVRKIVESRHDFYVPLLAVGQGLVQACRRNATHEARFAFRSDNVIERVREAVAALLTADEIIVGRSSVLENVVHLLSSQRFQSQQWSQTGTKSANSRARTSGELPTTAVRSVFPSANTKSTSQIILMQVGLCMIWSSACVGTRPTEYSIDLFRLLGRGGLCSLLPVASNHDHGQERAHHGRCEQGQYHWDPDGPDTGWEEALKRVVVVNEGLAVVSLRLISRSPVLVP